MDDRLTNIEVKFAFLEDTVATLDQYVRELGRQMDSMQRQIEQLAAMQNPQNPREAPRRLEDEVPPHY